MTAALAWWVALALAAPTVDEVIPSPLPLEAIGELAGAGFDGTTRVSIGGVEERVIAAEATRVRFIVAEATPLGAQTMIVTTGGEATEVAVEVVPPPPAIDVVEPSPLVLGALATIAGERLASVTAVTIDGIACALGEQTDAVLVVTVPFDGALVGAATLVLESASGAVREDVVVVAPRPVIDALAPNPVRAGALVTVRGPIVGEAGAVKVEIAAVEVPIVDDGLGAHGARELTAWVPRTLAAGPYDVVVASGGVRSAPAGPLAVEAAADDAPIVSGVYPSVVAIGGDVWVAGADLDTIDAVRGGLTIVACERRACRLSSAGLAIGARRHALVGPSGAGPFELEASAEAPVVPVVTSVTPSPATRGEALVIRGHDLAGVRSVVLGGVAQSITFVDVDRVEVVVAVDTPLGAEPLFVAGNAGSAPTSVTVLDPLPDAEADAGAHPEVPAHADEGAAVEVEPRAAGGDEGCAGDGRGGALVAWTALALACVGLARGMRRR